MARLPLFTMALLACWPAVAIADPITITADLRRVQASASVTEFDTTDSRSVTAGPGGTLSAFVDAAAASDALGHASATMTSSLADPLHLSGSGTVDAGFVAPVAHVDASSLFDVTFHLDSTYAYAFAGTFDSGGIQSDRYTFVSAQSWAALAGPTADVFRFDAGTFMRTGVLLAGDYRFTAGGEARAQTFRPAGPLLEFANFAFRFDLAPGETPPSPTPEAGSLTLMVLGLLGFYGSRVLQVLRF
jgi:hypothetical protein